MTTNNHTWYAMHPRKRSIMIETAKARGAWTGPQTAMAVVGQIPQDVADSMTGKQLGMIYAILYQRGVDEFLRHGDDE